MSEEDIKLILPQPIDLTLEQIMENLKTTNHILANMLSEMQTRNNIELAKSGLHAVREEKDNGD